MSDNHVFDLMNDPNRKKPEFMSEPGMDKVVSALLRLAMEISVLRDKVNLQRDLLQKHNILDHTEFDTYELDEDEIAKRDAANFTLVKAIANDLK